MVCARDAYVEALRSRKAGEVSNLDHTASWEDTKPDFYADSTLLTRKVAEQLQTIFTTNSPYGLVDDNGRTIETLRGRNRSRWMNLETGLASTVKAAYDVSAPPISSCPYHEVLEQKLGFRALRPLMGQHCDLDELRQVSAPGGTLAPGLIVPLMSRIPAIAETLRSSCTPSELAQNSAASLLRAPLAHPQQWARPFVFCLTGKPLGEYAFDRRSFLTEELIRAYIKLEKSRNGREQAAWAKDTADFTTRTAITVISRQHGSERYNVVGGKQIYPAGTRLGDIHVDEPTIGCPGAQVAYMLWDKALAITKEEELWAEGY